MDLGFSRFDSLRQDTAAAPVDYFGLVETVTTMQVASRTAMTEATLSANNLRNTSPSAAIVELFNADPHWTAAVTTLGGSFHPASARTAAEFGR